MYMYIKGQCIFGKKSNLTRKVGVFQTHFTSLKVFPWIHFPHALLRTFHSTKCRNDARSWLTPACFGVGIPWPSSRAVISYADAVMALEVQWGSAEHSWGGIPSFVLQLCESSAPLFSAFFCGKKCTQAATPDLRGDQWLLFFNGSNTSFPTEHIQALRTSWCLFLLEMSLWCHQHTLLEGLVAGSVSGSPSCAGHTDAAVGFSLASVCPLGLCPGCSCFKPSVQMSM